MASTVTRKRKRTDCFRCSEENGWVGEKWIQRVNTFHESCGSKSVSHYSHPHLTSDQKRSLLSIFFTDDGCCKLCTKCFKEFTGTSGFVRKRLMKLVHEVGRVDLLLDFSSLENGNKMNSNHSISPVVSSSIYIFCLRENVLHWNPCKFSLVFNVDVNSWRAQHRAYESYCSERGISLKIPTRKTYTKIVRSKFPTVKIGRLAKMKDACDVCVLYWKEKKSYSHYLTTHPEGRRPPDFQEVENAFIDCHAIWQKHLEFAYHERSYYKANYLLARRDFQNHPSTVETLHISVDAMKIQSLPHFVYPESHSLYFLNKLKMYVMGIVNEGTETSILYTWDATNGPTTTNHVLTCIWLFLQSARTNEKFLRITMDNCGVNKAYLFTSFVVALVTLGYFERVDLDWLVVGHTKFAPDRLFGLASQILQKNEYASLNDVKKLFTMKIASTSGNEIVTNIINFSLSLNRYFRMQKFFSGSSGLVGIQSLQGFRVARKDDGSIKTTAIYRHSYSEEQRAILLNTPIQKTVGPLPTNPLVTEVELLLNDWIPSPKPPGKEIEVLTLKKNVSLSNLVWPANGESWDLLPAREIQAELLLDLWRACDFSVSGLKTDYQVFSNLLMKEEISYLKKNPKFPLDVRGGIESIRQQIASKLGSQVSDDQEKSDEVKEIEKKKEEEEEEEERKEKEMETETETETETESEKEVDESKEEKEEKKDKEEEEKKKPLSKVVHRKRFPPIPDEELKICEIIEREEKEVLHSLAFEFSKVVEDALHDVQQGTTTRSKRERKRKELKGFVTQVGK
jgi:hypothetical protein